MSMSAEEVDYRIDRRKLRRKLTFWRVFALIIVILVVVGVALRFGGGKDAALKQPHIARLAITGLITGDEGTLKLVRQIADSPAAGVLLMIESPGGTTTGSELLFDELRRLAAKKPVAAVVGTMAASGAYIAALGADRIFAHDTSIVGSIGVLVEFPNFAGLLDKVGVKFETIKSAPLKASPNGLEPTSDAARAAIASLVSDSFDWFKGLVRDRRHMSEEELAAVDDGRIYTGRQSMPLKLIDALGGEREAIAWLENEKGVAKNLPVEDWKREEGWSKFGLLGGAASLADGLGLTELGDGLRRAAVARESGMLDGLVSVWQLPQGF